MKLDDWSELAGLLDAAGGIAVLADVECDSLVYINDEGLRLFRGDGLAAYRTLGRCWRLADESCGGLGGDDEIAGCERARRALEAVGRGPWRCHGFRVPWDDGRHMRLIFAYPQGDRDPPLSPLPGPEGGWSAGLLAVEDGMIRGVTPGLALLSGYRGDDLIGRPLGMLLPDQGKGRGPDRDAGSDGVPREGVLLRRDGGRVPVQVGRTILFPGLAAAEAGRVQVLLLRDLSRERALAQRLERILNVDNVTGLPNRRSFIATVESALSGPGGGEGVAILALYVDDLSLVNEGLGFEAGDAVLAEIGRRLVAVVGDARRVARTGADGFSVLCLDASSAEQAAGQAESIRLYVGASRVIVEGNEIPISCRVGISRCPADGVVASDLLRNAEIALHRAKRSGSLAGFFDSSLSTSVTERLGLWRDLARAMMEGELELWYQPQISLANHELIGAEALIRWRHPERGLIPPARFIPLAEESDIILSLGGWVLFTACRQISEWSKAGLGDLRVAVNISPRQFNDPELPSLVQAALAEHGVSPELLELEMTESILVGDIDSTVDTLRRLKALGVGLAIDDFGTGYSSLSYLRRFAVDRVKIDRSFVSELHQNEDDRIIVTAIIAMAHGLSLTTIAEGVETATQAALLTEYGCEEMQGYLIAPPVPAREFFEFATAHRAGDGTPFPANSGGRSEIFRGVPANKRRGITWKRSMSVGIHAIDQDHEELIIELNRLFSMIEDGSLYETCLEQLDMVIARTREHFSNEERIMRNIGYPRYGQHQQKHEWLIHDVLRFRESLRIQLERDNVMSIYSYLRYWLLRHLIGEDRGIRDFILRRG